MTERYKGCFRCLGSDRNIYRVDIYAQSFTTGSTRNPGAQVEGITLYRTSEGQTVTRISENVYRIESKGIELTPIRREEPAGDARPGQPAYDN